MLALIISLVLSNSVFFIIIRLKRRQGNLGRLAMSTSSVWFGMMHSMKFWQQSMSFPELASMSGVGMG